MIFGTFSSHSWIQRAHSLFSFFMTCTGISFALIALSSFLIKTPNPQVSLYVNHLKLYILLPNPRTRGIEDPYMNRLTNLLDFNLSLEVDFTPVVHWNVKQLFVYLVLEYETTSFEKNSIVIWDRIIRRSDAKRISISRLRNKYAVNDYNDLFQ